MSSWSPGTDGKKTDQILYFLFKQVGESLSSAFVWIRYLVGVCVVVQKV